MNAEEVLAVQEDTMVVDALRTAGIEVLSVYDLVNSRKPYPEAIEVLLEMLPRVRHDRVKEGVARALGVREARPVAAKPLIREFLEVPSETKSQQHTKWAVGNALSTVADDSVFDEVLAIVSDRRHGWTRSGIVNALCNMKANRPRAVAALTGFLTDEDIEVEAMMALGALHVREARPQIASFLEHSDSWVRQQAKRALAKIDRAAAKLNSPA